MIRSGLYGVMTHIMQSHSEDNVFSISIGNQTYKFELKLDADGKKYLIVQLPFSANNATLALSQGNYTLNDCHFTVYSEQGREDSLLRPHFTGNYKNIVTDQNLILRGYVGEGDGICINSMRASTSRKTKNKPRIPLDVPQFFAQELDKKLFKNHLLAYISPLMIFLRATQADLTLTLEQKYQDLLKIARGLNAKHLKYQSTDTIEECQRVSAKLVETSTLLANFSDDQRRWSSTQPIHQQQLEYYGKQLAGLKQLAKQELTVESALDDGCKAEEMTQPVATSKLPADDTWKPQVSELRGLLNKRFTHQSAQKLANLIDALNDLLFTTDTLSIEEQYESLYLALAAKKYLADNCYQALLNGDDSLVIADLSKYLPNTPQHIISALIEQDNDVAIKSLLKQDLVSIYALAHDGRPFYTHAYEQDRIKSVTLYAKFGIHPILMVINDIRSIFYATEINIEQMRRTLTKYDEINMHLQKEIGMSGWIVLMDNLVCTLRATRHDLLYYDNKGKRRSKRAESNATGLIDVALSFMEILQRVFKVLSEEDLALISSNEQIMSLKPLIDLLPRNQANVRFNLVKILEIVRPFVDLLEKIKTRFRALDINQIENLRQLMIASVIQETQKTDGDEFLKGYIQGVYLSFINSEELTGRTPKMRHAQAISKTAELIESFTSTMTLFDGFGTDGKLAMVTDIIACGKMFNDGLLSQYEGRELRDFIKTVLTVSESPHQKLLNYFNANFHISQRDIDNLMHTCRQAASSPGSLFIEVVPEAVNSTATTVVSSLQRLSLFANSQTASDASTIDDHMKCNI